MKLVILLILLATIFLAPSVMAVPMLPADLLQQEFPAEGNELLGERKWNSKKFQLGPSRFALDISVGPVHYRNNPRDNAEDWKDIDNDLAPASLPWDWEMTKDGYNTRFLEDFTAGQIMEYSTQGETVAFQPMALQWTNDLDQIDQIAMPESSVVSIVENNITWEGAYGIDTAFTWENQAGRLKKVLELGSPPPPPAQYILDGGNPVLELAFIFDPSRNLEIWVNGSLWNQRDTVSSLEAIEFRKDGEVLFVFSPAITQDSSLGLSPASQSVTQLRRSGNKLYVTTRTDYDWLQAATYSIYIDPTVDIRVGASADDIRYLPFSTNSTFFLAGRNPPGADIHSAARFLNITIANATEINADTYMQLTADGNWSGTTVNTDVFLEDADDPGQITNATDFDDRLLTAAVTWDNIPAWVDNQADADTQTPSLETPIQTVIDRGGWASGQAMIVFWKEGGTTATNTVRDASSYDEDTGAAPLLHIDYEAGADPDVTGYYMKRLFDDILWPIELVWKQREMILVGRK